MYRFLKYIGLFLLFLSAESWAAEMPFTDVKTTDSYYNAVRDLYKNGVISDDGSHLFRPNELMARDFYVALAVTVGCKKCTTPSPEDIVKYQISPFVDLTKINPYYYCIAYAQDAGVAQGYIPDTTGKAYCENEQSYVTSPFCAENNISRIEAAAVLLRRANLWNDTLNSGNFERSLTLSGVSNYWYGYAKKGIEIGIISQKPDLSIGHDEKITRGEFALMAAKIFTYTQCQLQNVDNTLEGAIGVRDNDGSLVHKSLFDTRSCPTLIPLTSTGSWEYAWSATHLTTGKMLTGSQNTLPTCPGFEPGMWNISLHIIDPYLHIVVSSPTASLVFSSGGTTSSHIGVLLEATPLTTYIGGKVTFRPQITNPLSHTLQYAWDFGDGTRSITAGDTQHIYIDKGVYTATLTVTDPTNGEVVQSSVIIQVTGNKDSDGDGLFDDDDRCPHVVGPKENSGCPNISLWNPGDSLRNIIANSCLTGKRENFGLIIGSPICEQCPCKNHVNILSPLRSCDVVFPTILSPDLKDIYSRGKFYIVP